MAPAGRHPSSRLSSPGPPVLGALPGTPAWTRGGPISDVGASWWSEPLPRARCPDQVRALQSRAGVCPLPPWCAWNPHESPGGVKVSVGLEAKLGYWVGSLGPSPQTWPPGPPQERMLPTQGQLNHAWRVRRSVYLSETPLESGSIQSADRRSSNDTEGEAVLGSGPSPGHTSAAGGRCGGLLSTRAWKAGAAGCCPHSARRFWTVCFRFCPGRAQTAVRSQFRARHD